MDAELGNENHNLGFRVLGFRVKGLGSATTSCKSPERIEKKDMGGCQNDGPFLDPYYNTAPKIQGTQKGTIILTTTRMITKAGRLRLGSRRSEASKGGSANERSRGAWATGWTPTGHGAEFG